MNRTLWLPPLLLGVVMGGCAHSPRQAEPTLEELNAIEHTPEELVTIRGVVSIPETTSIDVARVVVRYENGALAIKMSPDRRGVYGTRSLFPDETYTVSAEFAMGPRGPWHFPSATVEATPGSVHRLDFAPFAGDAVLHVDADDGTQPYMFALYPEGTPVPEDRRDFQAWFDEGKGYRTPVYLRRDEGGGKAWREPTMPAGRYLVIAMANDWQPGDPDAEPVVCEVELVSGDVTRLHLGARCTTIEER